MLINATIFRQFIDDEEVFVGMEYIKDPERIPVRIKYKFRAPVVYENINFDIENLHVRQLKNGEILCTLERNISKKLFVDICKFSIDPESSKKTNNFILGYVYRTLGIINDRILKDKYDHGLFLVKPISIFDIYEIGVLNANNEGGMAVWPVPYHINHSNLDQEVYSGDLIDAITSYLTFNYDDCIRKIVTSLEIFLKIDKKKKNRMGFIKKILKISNDYSLRTLIKKLLVKENYFIEQRNLQVLADNLSYIYSLRCRIVHNDIRLKSRAKIICIKGIISASYALQSKSNQGDIGNLTKLIMQFTSIDQYGLLDLDFLENYLVRWNRKKIGNFNHGNNWKTMYLLTRFFDISCDLYSKEFTDALFDDLRITRAEKKLV